MGRNTSLLFGFVVGGMVGWLAGIFSAPQSGQETRHVIGERAIELRDKVGETAERVKEEVLTTLDRSVELEAD